MIYIRIIMGTFILLTIVYYTMVIGHLFGAWKMTNRPFTFIKLCIPFYYWAVLQNINKKSNNKTKKKND